MYYPEKRILLKDGRSALFTGPAPEMAEEMIAYMKTTAGETPFLLRTPSECTATVEGEAAYLRNLLESEYTVMIVCFVDGKLAGNCQLARKGHLKNRHRGTIGIAILREFWGLGIGSAMFDEMLEIAHCWGLSQVELEVIEGNSRAMALYKKMGFETVAAIPDAIRLEDGTSLQEFTMVKKL